MINIKIKALFDTDWYGVYNMALFFILKTVFSFSSLSYDG